ncbi:MAG: bifunctional NADH-specific enoyl-ACP reductase/trans-2-enoyl-CoA reductase, partial [Bdellovibrionota bacterium]
KLDADGRLRADLAELEPKVQDAVAALWNQVTDDNVNEISDFAGYKAEFLRLFGFEIAGVDYEADVNPTVKIEGLVQA